MALVALLVIQFWNLHVIRARHFREQAESNRYRLVTLAAPRGALLDREGRVLVGNRPSFNVVLVPEHAVDLDRVVARRARTLGMGEAAIRERLARRQPYRPLVVKVDAPLADVAALEARRLELPEVSVEVVPLRSYPLASAAAHALGRVGDTTVNLDPDWEVGIYTPGGDTPTSGNASASFTPTVQDLAGALDYARTDAVLTIRHKWRDLDGDNVRDAGEIVLYDASRIPPENTTAGSPVEVIEVAGHFAEARRRLRVEVTRFPFSPNVMAALNCNTGADLRGNVHVCGHNHSVDTPENTHLEYEPAVRAELRRGLRRPARGHDHGGSGGGHRLHGPAGRTGERGDES